MLPHTLERQSHFEDHDIPAWIRIRLYAVFFFSCSLLSLVDPVLAIISTLLVTTNLVDQCLFDLIVRICYIDSVFFYPWVITL
ncbi:unnamed protein product [Callosobruchus maculatus]|uniref:Uncharacterized protein n=1 Tax=Callosobruchus maculatus TaxID=64391 RepID=A0A653CD13_CALMS|nr:unnamed protein product [Callosobruchus maculatus]